MNSQQLNTRITLQRRTPGAADALGQPLPDAWEPVAQIWANVRNLSGTEAIKAGAVTSAVTASIRIRYRTDLDAGMRVLVGAAMYEIKALMADLQRREFVDLVCEALS